MTTAFFEQMAHGPRKIVVTGHFGSGKTEFAVSLAFALAAPQTRLALADLDLALVDLDIENPYFRSRERQDQLRAAGIAVYSDPYGGRNGSELQTIDSAIRAPLEDEQCRVICDAGGDYSGAMVLNQFRKYFQTDTQLLCVVNHNRPGTDTVDKALWHLQRIEETTQLRATGLIANSHMLVYTTVDDIVAGWQFTQALAERSGVPALCACCMRSLLQPTLDWQAAHDSAWDLFPIGMYMRDSYLDRPV